LKHWPDLFLQKSTLSEYSIYNLLNNESFSIDHLHMILEHLKARDQLHLFIPYISELRKIITPAMIEMLFEYIPYFDPCIRYGRFGSFIVRMIVFWKLQPNPRTSPLQILQEIKKHYSITSDRSNADIPTDSSWKWHLNDFIKNHSHIVHRISEPNPSVILVELCPDLFPHIERSNLTQDLANAYYSYQKKSDQDQELYQLIPEEYQTNLTNTRSGSKTKPALRTDFISSTSTSSTSAE
jgi:hypothetical protein